MANIELDGANKKITVDSGDLTLDVPGDIILDADGADLVFADGGTNILKVTNSSSDVVFQNQVDAKDIIFKQYDGTEVAKIDDDGSFKVANSPLSISQSSSDVIITPLTDAKDIFFQQYDGRTLLDINDGGYVGIANGATGPGQLRLYEDTDNGTNYTAFQVGTQSGDVTYTLPTADGSNGHALTTNGSGTLSWASAGTTYAGIDDQTSSNDDQLTITDSAIIINEDSDDVDFRVESDGVTHGMFYDGGTGEFGLNESATDCSGGGACFNQGSADNGILTFKSSDISHTFTGIQEADTWVAFVKREADEGGLRLETFSEATVGFEAWSHCKDVNTGSNASARAGIEFSTYTDDGTGRQACGGDDNLFNVRNGTYTQFMVKGSGELWANSTLSNYDTYEDAHLVRAFDLSKGEKSKGLINSQFDKYIKYNHETLVDAGLVGKEDNGTPNHYINVTGMQRLHNGAIWQQYEKHQQLLEAVYDLAKEAVGEEKANAILDKHEVKRLQ